MTIERKLSIKEMLERFAFLGTKLPRCVFVALLVSSKAMLASVTRKLRGDYLNVRTGRGWQSMQDFARTSGDKMQAGIDTNVRYMRAHEEGFHGTVQVRAHTAQRRGRILAQDIKSRKAKRARLTKREIARGAWLVRAHPMKMNLRARHFMRDTIDQQFVPTQDRILKALVIAAETGQIPTPGQLGV